MDTSKGLPPTRLTIFNQLLDPGVTEGHVVPSVDDLKDEAFSIVTAAADTTGNAMTIAAYNVISNKIICHKLVAELTAHKTMALRNALGGQPQPEEAVAGEGFG